MASSPLRLALTFMCLAGTVGVICCGRPHMLLNPALDGTQAGPAVEELPERLSLPELQWMLRNNELEPVEVDEAPRGRMELVRRDNTVTAKPLNCMNYFWKSRTAC